MPELFEPLRSLTDESVQAPPPAEVRRRGDRIRRRRTALQTAGAACVVAVLIGGGVLVTGAGTGSSRVPAGPATNGPSPTATTEPKGPVSRIPDDFPLAANLEPGGDVIGPHHRLSFVGELEICAASYSPADLEVDHLTVTSDGPGGSVQGRQLMLFPTAGTAAQMAEDLVATYQGCPEYELQGTTVRNQVEQSSLGDQAWTVVHSATRADGSTANAAVVHVVRVGRAMLVAMTRTTSPDATPEPSTASVEPVVDAMCVFTSDGC